MTATDPVNDVATSFHCGMSHCLSSYYAFCDKEKRPRKRVAGKNV